jgi:hypothetical protein
VLWYVQQFTRIRKLRGRWRLKILLAFTSGSAVSEFVDRIMIDPV